MQNGQPAPVSATGAIDTPTLPAGGQEYTDILRTHGLAFTETEYHLNVGIRPETKGWILHLSVIYTQFPRLLETCLPLLLSAGTAFRIAKSEDMLNAISGARYGKEHVGKIITLYPETNKQAVVLAQELIFLTDGFSGPIIHTDIRLGNIVYTRYGGSYPRQLEDERPLKQQMIANLFGQRIPDLLFDPYYLPEQVEWPFNAIKAHEAPAIEKLLHNKYTITKTLKADMKGNVYEASYFTGFTHEPCVIKAGNRFLSVDKNGRDSSDRVKWQWHLHKTLHSVIPVPRPYEIFEKEQTVYMVMELAKGTPLRYWVESKRRNLHWQKIPAKDRKSLINMLIRIIEIIENMHAAGFLHRDITYENFLIDTKRNITLIDLELSYPIEEDPAQPPFSLGSPGFMSPEQLLTKTPTIAQDIYAIGGMLVYFLTGLSPQKIDQVNKDFQEKQLLFLTADPAITQLIMSCFQPEPERRPLMVHVKEALFLLLQEADIQHPIKYHAELPEQLLQVPTGSYDWQDFQKGLFQDFMAHLPGLANGKAGIALTTAGALRNGKLPETEEIKNLIAECFLEDAEESLDIATGIAGQGLALLDCIKWIEDVDFRRAKLDNYVSRLIEQQQPDGTWLLSSQKDNNPAPGIWDGMAGIVIFLIEYRRRRKQIDCTEAIDRGLQWFLQQPKKDYYVEGWYHSNVHGAHEITSFNKGSIGIAFLFIKAYLLMEEYQYKQMASSLLNQIPDNIVMDNFGLLEGLSGLGEAYLAAWIVFQDKIWLDRTEWIVALMEHAVIPQTEAYHMFWRGLAFPELASARSNDYEYVFLYNYLSERMYTEQTKKS